MYPLAITANQIMPFRQILTFGDAYVSTSRRQPVKAQDVFRFQLHAVADVLLSIFIIGTLTGVGIEQFATDIGLIQLTGFGVLEFIGAAFAATVA